MSAEIHNAKAMSGEVVQIVGSANQQKVRPGEYIVFDDDITSDIAVKTNQDLTKPIKRFDMFLIVMNKGLEQIELAPANYNFTRTMRADIRNVGTHELQKAEYQALINKPVKADVVQEVTAAQSYIQDIKNVIAGKTAANLPIDYTALEAGIKTTMPTVLQAEIIKAVIPQQKVAPQPLNFTF